MFPILPNTLTQRVLWDVFKSPDIPLPYACEGKSSLNSSKEDHIWIAK
jgi:hypothetical protein